jgi:hypothetical protein
LHARISQNHGLPEVGEGTVILRKEYEDRSEWALEHYEVNYIHLDCRFGFDLYGFSGSDGYLKIVVEVPFTLTDGDAEIRFDPEDLGTIGGALKILHKLAHKVVVYRNGTLRVEFQDGLSFRVEKHPQYESWEAHGEGELSEIRLLCSPH